MAFPLRLTREGEHEERAEDLDSSQASGNYACIYMSDKNQVCCNNDLAQTLTLLHSEWRNEFESSGQSSTPHPLAVRNPIDKKGLEFMRRSMRLEAPSMPISAHDPGLLREQEMPPVIGKNWFLDQEIPAGSFVRIQDSSQVWEGEWTRRE